MTTGGVSERWPPQCYLVAIPVNTRGHKESIGFGGLFTGRIEVEGVRVHLHRDIWFDRDIDGSWTIVGMLPEDRDKKGFYPNDAPAGGILVTDPTVQAFIDRLALLMADPGGFADNEIIGPEPGSEPTEGGTA